MSLSCWVVIELILWYFSCYTLPVWNLNCTGKDATPNSKCLPGVLYVLLYASICSLKCWGRAQWSLTVQPHTPSQSASGFDTLFHLRVTVHGGSHNCNFNRFIIQRYTIMQHWGWEKGCSNILFQDIIRYKLCYCNMYIFLYMMFVRIHIFHLVSCLRNYIVGNPNKAFFPTQIKHMFSFHKSSGWW